MNTPRAEVLHEDTRQCEQCATSIGNEHQGERSNNTCSSCAMGEAPPQGAGLALIKENQDQCQRYSSSLPDYSESSETSVEEEDSDGSDIPCMQETETWRSPPMKRGACDGCRKKRVGCVHRGLVGKGRVQNKRKAAVDEAPTRKKRILRIVTYSDDTDGSQPRTKREQTDKPSTATSTNPNQAGYMLPTYVNYRERMDAQLTTFTEDVNAVFFSLQATVASMQATIDKAQQACETLDDYRGTLERWAAGCAGK